MITIVTTPGRCPPDYAEIPISFTVHAEVIPGADGLYTRPLPAPHAEKDYDALPDNHPDTWAERWDLSGWIFLAARVRNAVVGRAVVVIDAPGVDMLEGRADLAVLWDLRVAPSARRQGVGRELFLAAVTAATKRGCVEIKIETQANNVDACLFYEAMNCRLTEADPRAYAGTALADEVQLIWRRALLAEG